MKLPVPSSKRRRAFTLIELVISAALMSMVLGAAYVCLRSGVLSDQMVETRAEVLQNARVALALISADLRSARSLSRDIDFLGMDRMMGEIEADNLDFATAYVPTRAGEADFCETSYFLERDAESGLISLWRRRDPVADDEPLSGGKREEIARGVAGLRFEYYDGFDWYDEWGDPQGKRRGQASQTSLLAPPNLSGLPEAVQVTLWFDSNPRRKPAAAGEKETKEPPLVFTTVARLNLAALSQSSASSSSTTEGAASSNQPGQPATGGPQR